MENSTETFGRFLQASVCVRSVKSFEVFPAPDAPDLTLVLIGSREKPQTVQICAILRACENC